MIAGDTGSRRDTTFRPDTLAKSGNCAFLDSCIARDTAEHLRTDNAVLATNGFAADGKNFVKRVKQRLEVSCLSTNGGPELTPRQWYQHAHNKPMGLKAIARMIQTMLYSKRFFPYYVYNILGGIEEDGQ